MSTTFPAKLLLFGEYTVLSGSQALAVPLTRWQGKWKKQDQEGHIGLIPEYYQWLSKVEIIDAETMDKMADDLREGWTFDADIPIGYGVGSSGAYVAAVYHRYLQSKKTKAEKETEILARMESYFHGSSSGMDPMVSLSGQAVYRDENGVFQTIKDPGWPKDFHVYLLDSGIPRETGSLVKHYQEQVVQDDFQEKMRNDLIPMVEHAIHLYLQGGMSMIEDCLAVISKFQRKHFNAMIPDVIRDQWDALSKEPDTYVKLCGAGGGGYFLVISKQKDLQGNYPLINVADK